MSKKAKFAPRFREAIVSPTGVLRDAISSLTRSGLMLVCLADNDDRLVGVISDGDIRKALLNGATLESPVSQWATSTPVTAPSTASAGQMHDMVLSTGKREIPLVDEKGRLVDLYALGLYDQAQPTEQETPSPVLENAVMILAGGLGTRLRSIVTDRPKPLAMVGGRPLLELIMERLVRSGLRSFYVAVNYMAEQIEAHFTAPQYKDLDVRFVRERDRLGTAGAIGYIGRELKHPLLVCNADLLTTVPFEQILRQHNKENADITCVVRPHVVSVPFGVVDLANGVIAAVREKPDFTYFVNAGIYVLSVDVCREIDEGRRLDMPEVIERVMARGGRVVPFLLHEYWLDIGRPEDYHKANEDIGTMMGDRGS